MKATDVFLNNIAFLFSWVFYLSLKCWINQVDWQRALVQCMGCTFCKKGFTRTVRSWHVWKDLVVYFTAHSWSVSRETVWSCIEKCNSPYWSEGLPHRTFHSCAQWDGDLVRWGNPWRVVAVVGVMWKFKLTFRSGNYIWRFSSAFGFLVGDTWEWSPSF